MLVVMSASIKSIQKRLKREFPVEFFMTLVKVFNPNSYADSRTGKKSLWNVTGE